MPTAATSAVVTWQSIAQANHLTNPDLIHPGEKLLIP
jgi:nucleoid-associated protein YgaU